MDAEHAGRRLRAARVLADIDRNALAARLDIPGLGEKTLGAMERGEREIKSHELPAIAAALEVSPRFFSVDFVTLADGATDTQAQLDAIQQMVGNVLTLMGENSKYYAEFIQEVRNLIIPVAGEVESELDAARLADELPTQRLARGDENQPARSAGRRQRP